MSKPKYMLCQDCLDVRDFSLHGHLGYYNCSCGGVYCGCPNCNETSRFLLRMTVKQRKNFILKLKKEGKKT